MQRRGYGFGARRVKRDSVSANMSCPDYPVQQKGFLFFSNEESNVTDISVFEQILLNFLEVWRCHFCRLFLYGDSRE